jgi:hypothetical protein
MWAALLKFLGVNGSVDDRPEIHVRSNGSAYIDVGDLVLSERGQKLLDECNERAVNP